MSALIEKVLNASLIEVNVNVALLYILQHIFCCKEKYFSIKLINYCILKATHDTDNSKCHYTSYALLLRHAMQSENFGNGHSCSSCAFIRISNDIYL